MGPVTARRIANGVGTRSKKKNSMERKAEPPKPQATSIF